MDVLSDVLNWLRVEGTVSRRSEFSAPWGVAYPVVNLVSFMVVEKGSCFMLPDGKEPVCLEAGDLMMFSPGHQKSFVDQPATPTVPYARVLEQVRAAGGDTHEPEQGIYPTLSYGGGGRQTVVIGWGLRFEGDAQNALLSLLPPSFHLTYEQRTALPWLDTTLRFILHETHRKGDGSDMMIVRLVELLFVQLIRAWFEQQPDGEAGWLGALRDPSIGQALRLIHRYPTDGWTVASLAKAVGMSRSNFSSRFGGLVGTPPLTYLTQLRMRLAVNALTGDVPLSVGEVARQVGYESEASFGRAFKRQLGTTPAAFRRAHLKRRAETTGT
ncbi:MAG: AraC family transcriptional regulator [Proteobacteria bacterium]|nr:AraC family transcriptional regulator [Pseudomonadota bacterium]